MSVRYNHLDSRPDQSRVELVVARLRQPPDQTHGAELPELELHHPREHPVDRRRVELRHRHNDVEQPHRRLHASGREPRIAWHILPVRRHPGGRIGLHVVRLRAVHAEQRAALQHVPAPEQLHEVQQQALADVRRQRRAVRLRERVLLRLAERLRLQLAGRLLHGRQRLPGQPEPDDVAGHAPRFQVRWNNIPGQEKPIQPLEVFYTGGYAQDDWRVAQQPQGRSSGCASTCRSSATPATRTPTPTR